MHRHARLSDVMIEGESMGARVDTSRGKRSEARRDRKSSASSIVEASVLNNTKEELFFTDDRFFILKYEFYSLKNALFKSLTMF